MKWHISFSKDSLRFLECNHLEEDLIFEEIKSALRKFAGEDINVSIKKLKGEWEGFYRIRSDKLGIIVEFRFENCEAYIEEIDWRGGVYK